MTKKRSARSIPAPEIYCPTLIEFLLDETGSMASWEAATISGYNTFLAEQRAVPDTCLLTLTKFDTAGLKTPYTDINVNMLPDMTKDTFCPGGGTNLRDAIKERVEAVKARTADWPVKPHVLFVVMTDGEDNASRTSVHDTRALVTGHEAEGWTFVYLGATLNAIQIAQQLGFKPGNSKQFEGTQMYQTMTSLSQSTVAYRAARTNSATTVADQNFFR